MVKKMRTVCLDDGLWKDVVGKNQIVQRQTTQKSKPTTGCGLYLCVQQETSALCDREQVAETPICVRHVLCPEFSQDRVNFHRNPGRESRKGHSRAG